MRRADVACTDETGWLEVKNRVWLWTVVIGLHSMLVKSWGVVMRALLGPEPTGVVGSDCWSAYNPDRGQVVCDRNRRE